VSRRRDVLLAEMGLVPLWRLRRLPPAALPTGRHAATAAAGPETPPPVATSRAARILQLGWPELKSRVAACTDCRLRATCSQTVFGVGDERARWLLVGEAPGAEEDRLGEPFVGQAGKLLDNMLAAIGLRRGEDVYIANVLKCRPPGNRNPDPSEVAVCAPYLQRQIALIEPKLILAMGRFAAQTLLGTDASIGSLRGTVHRHAGVPLIVTYHPAYLLRNLTDKAKAWADLRFAARTLAAPG
jgi:uracil-DNA glycosylase family 4